MNGNPEGKSWLDDWADGKVKTREWKTFIGIDLSLGGTGIVVLGDDETVFRKETYAPTRKGRGRLREIRDRIVAVAKSYDDPTVAIEGYSFASRGRGVFSTAELGGVVRLALLETGVPLYEVPPTTLKQFVTGKGNAKKEHMILEVYKRWGVECATSDEADAYGLAQMARALVVPDIELTKFQKTALGKAEKLTLGVA